MVTMSLTVVRLVLAAASSRCYSMKRLAALLPPQVEELRGQIVYLHTLQLSRTNTSAASWLAPLPS